jgi:hypothetical protein
VKILVVLEGSAHMDEILDDHPSDFALPPEAADDLIATAFIYLSTWYEVFLHFKALDIALPLFGLTGKGHILMHACLLSRYGFSHHTNMTRATFTCLFFSFSVAFRLLGNLKKQKQLSLSLYIYIRDMYNMYA